MNISIILGTRPEIIKMSPLIRECEKRNLDYFVLHTGQHYSYDMDRAFFDDLELPEPAYNLDVGSGSHAEQTGKIMEGIEKVIIEEKPDVVLVQGDTNTVLAGTLAASKVHIKVGHVEAGLRSYDRSMPEEINRVVADHVSDYLFAPTELSKQNLLKEGIEESKIFVTGNTIVDAIFQNLEISNKKVDILNDLGLKSKEYFLLTSHRAENVDNRENLGKLLKGISTIQKEYSLPVIFPIHPRTEKRIKEFGFSLEGIRSIRPVGFLEFLQLEANARLVFTDSGGVQEETCILGTPCVTLRDNTERPETLGVGSNILAGVEPDRIIQSAVKMMGGKKSWINPFGNGRAAEKIIDALRPE
ncbi:MAG: UDP-N-acetylglucosamine 2-epimerase (non-hydrolyzing) [Methanosarcina sp.]